MSTKEYSDVQTATVGTSRKTEGPCGGAMEQSERVFRHLRSTRDGRVKITQKIAKLSKPFDPTAWYLLEVKRHQEINSRNFLNSADLGYPVEAYTAAQIVYRRTSKDKGGTPYKEQVVIHGKIFVRVDEAHRVAILKACPLLKRYFTDPLSSSPDSNLPSFARIPDVQIQRVRSILNMADGLVEYTEQSPQVSDNIQVVGGPLTKGSLFKNIKGEIVMVNGRKHATVILDGIGCFKFRLPVEDLVKVKNL